MSAGHVSIPVSTQSRTMRWRRTAAPHVRGQFGRLDGAAVDHLNRSAAFLSANPTSRRGFDGASISDTVARLAILAHTWLASRISFRRVLASHTAAEQSHWSEPEARFQVVGRAWLRSSRRLVLTHSCYRLRSLSSGVRPRDGQIPALGTKGGRCFHHGTSSSSIFGGRICASRSPSFNCSTPCFTLNRCQSSNFVRFVKNISIAVPTGP